MNAEQSLQNGPWHGACPPTAAALPPFGRPLRRTLGRETGPLPGSAIRTAAVPGPGPAAETGQTAPPCSLGSGRRRPPGTSTWGCPPLQGASLLCPALPLHWPGAARAPPGAVVGQVFGPAGWPGPLRFPRPAVFLPMAPRPPRRLGCPAAALPLPVGPSRLGGAGQPATLRIERVDRTCASAARSEPLTFLRQNPKPWGRHQRVARCSPGSGAGIEAHCPPSPLQRVAASALAGRCCLLWGRNPRHDLRLLPAMTSG